MPLNARLKRQIHDRLGRYAPSLPQVFDEAVAELAGELPDDELNDWAQEGLDLAGHSMRSWEATSDYFRVGPAMRPNMDQQTFKQWVRSGRELADLSSAIAGAYFRASPTSMPHLAGAQIGEWAGLGQRLYKGTWKSISLASDFFAGSPVLFHSLSLAETGRLVHIIEGISERSAELAAACLESSIGAFGRMDKADRNAFLDFAAAVADASWPESNLYFQRGTDLLRYVTPDERTHYLDLSARVARRIGRQAYTLFSEGATALRDVDERLPRPPDRAGGPPRAPVARRGHGLPQVRAHRSRCACASTRSRRWHEAGLEILRRQLRGRRGLLPPRVRQGGADDHTRSRPASTSTTCRSCCACTARR